MNPLRIVLVEDHAVVREALKSLIDAQPNMTIVGEAGDGPTAVNLCANLQPDLVLMDVGLPGMNGAEATRRMRQVCPTVHVVALTQYDDKSYVRELFDAGARGYVLKRSASDQLIRAIETVAQGGTFFDPVVMEQVTNSFVRVTDPSDVLQVDLSDREESVLRLIAEGYSNKEIAHRLNLGVKSVETYKARAMEKLKLNSRAELVRYALLRGWLQNP
jgi:DNA-binding NarL/FixJ family response regulator